jgi:serine protease Do
MNDRTSPTPLGVIVDSIAPSLVAIARGGRGSGVVLAPGRVLVGTHGVRAERLAIARADGEVVKATLLAHDPDRTLALLDADTGDAPPIAWPDADPQPALGDAVVALARPSGRPLHATRGEIAAVGERLRGPRGRLGDPGLVHTAPLPRGAAGSPLLDADGALLGFSTARLDGGFLLAQPATLALRRHLDDLAEGRAGSVRTLGVAIAHPRAARRLRRAVGLPERDGLLLQEVADPSAAARAGLERGDLLVAVGDEPLTSVDALLAAIDATEGDLALRVVRGADERDVLVRWE